MRVETIHANGADAWDAGLVGVESERLRRVALTAEDVASLTVTDRTLSCDGDARLLRLGLQAYSLGIACEFDSVKRPWFHRAAEPPRCGGRRIMTGIRFPPGPPP